MNIKTTKYLFIFFAILLLILTVASVLYNTTSVNSSALETSLIDSSHNIAKDVQDAGQNDILIYSLPDDVFHLPVEQIPYYSAGDIKFLPQSLFASFSNGHQPWLGNYISVVQVQCKNLIRGGTIFGHLIHSLFPETTNDNPVIDTAEQFQLSNGLDIKLIQETDGVFVVQMTVPNLGKYKITLESPINNGILYIRKIVFYPDTK